MAFSAGSLLDPTAAQELPDAVAKPRGGIPRSHNLECCECTFLDGVSPIREEAGLLDVCGLSSLLIEKVETKVGCVRWCVQMQRHCLVAIVLMI